MSKELKLLEKATEGDKQRILAKAVRAKHSTNTDDYYCQHSAYLLDYDDEFVYWDIYVDGEYTVFKSTYNYNGTSATIGDEAVEVVLQTDPQVVVKDSNSSQSTFNSFVLSGVEKLLKSFGDIKGKGLPIVKQLDDEEMIAIEPLYIAIGDVDGVGDTYASEEVCRDMVASFNKAIEDGKMQGSYFHKMMTEDFTPVKAWLTETDCMIGETLVKEGQPLVKVKFNNEKAWEARKSNDLMGVSIGAVATWEDI